MWWGVGGGVVGLGIVLETEFSIEVVGFVGCLTIYIVQGR